MLHDIKAAYYTLGCKLNFAETSSFGEQLARRGIQPAKKGERARLCLINTCSVTEMADRKCRHAIRSMIRRHPGAIIVVTGCYAQLKSAEVAAIPGVSLVVGSKEKARLVDLILNYIEEHIYYIKEREQAAPTENNDTDKERRDSPAQVLVTPKPKDITTFAPSCSRGNRTRYFLKVQDGCNHFCTYCTIPLARGFSRNAPIADIVRQAEQVAQEGGKEIVITGVNIGDFGQSTGENFLQLITALDAVEGVCRYRISSIEPELLTDDIIRFCARSRKFMPHFHIPLQSGSDTVLRLMHRRYDTALFRQKIETIKSLMPDAFIGVDVMVGCRGETPECFDECLAFLRSIDFTQLHVFPYSERPGTAALKIPYIVDEEEKKRRVDALLRLSDERTTDFYTSHLGQLRPVLLERGKGNTLGGFTDNYIRVELKTSDSKRDNTSAPKPSDNQIILAHLDCLNDKKDAVIAHCT